MDLFILRHGLAADRGSFDAKSDAERQLTEEGRRRTKSAAEAMKALEIEFDRVFSSPFLRATQTAEIVARGLNSRLKVEACPPLASPGDSRALIALIGKLKPQPASLLLVGHEPHLSELISLLITGDKAAGITLKKGALCKLAVEGLRHGRCASLQWLMTARQMHLIGQSTR